MLLQQHIEEESPLDITLKAEASRTRVSLKDIRILIVDDCQYIRKFYAAVLGRYGAEVFAASSVDEALGVMDLVNPDVLLVDIFMPEKNGFELMKTLLGSRNPARMIPAAAISTLGDEWEKEALRSGFNKVLTKPVDPHTLVQVVQNLARGDRSGWCQ